MIRCLLSAAGFLGSSAIGLLVAAWLIPGVSVAQAILSPFGRPVLPATAVASKKLGA